MKRFRNISAIDYKEARYFNLSASIYNVCIGLRCLAVGIKTSF